MPEILLHYIWQQRLWEGIEQQTTDGLPIEILSVGQHNRDAGPDFSHAHLRIGTQEWVGNVEMHLRASDWRKHHHHRDPAYDSVILHVVCTNDEQALTSSGKTIPQCVLRYPFQQDYLTNIIQQAQRMDSAIANIPCSQQLLTMPAMLSDGWRKTLLLQRWQCKKESIDRLLMLTKQNWTHAFYITLAHNFGFHTNSQPFELLAIHTPLSCLLKHRSSVFQVTAILLGQSGLLNETSATTPEMRALWHEYQFLRQKFTLTPISAALWKKARMRPQNTPEVRIRQFAQLICQSEFLFSQSIGQKDIASMRSLFTLQPLSTPHQPYFTTAPPMGQASIDILLINTILPYRYAYSIAQHNAADVQQSLDLMAQLPAEDNRIIRQWRMIGQQVVSAADSQALIHLYQHYCQHERCIHCEVGQLVFEKEELTL